MLAFWQRLWARSIRPKSDRSDLEKWSTSKGGPVFWNFSGWTELIHWVLDRNFRKFWLNGSRPLIYLWGDVWRHVAMVALFLDDNKTNDDGDGKENGKKWYAYINKQKLIITTLHVQANLYICLPSLHQYTIWNFLISRARFMEYTTQKFSLSFS